MLTNKQLCRRICGAQRLGRGLVVSTRFDEHGATPTPLRRSQLVWPPNMMRPPLDSLVIGDSLLHLKCTSGQPSQKNGRTCASVNQHKDRSRVQGRVYFNFQVRVVLVPSRSELDRFKADIWWGEEDYISFRREYVAVARSNLKNARVLAALKNTAAIEAAKLGREWAERRNRAPPSRDQGMGSSILVVISSDEASSPGKSQGMPLGAKVGTFECSVKEHVAVATVRAICDARPSNEMETDDLFNSAAKDLDGDEELTPPDHLSLPIILTQREATSVEAAGISAGLPASSPGKSSDPAEDDDECRTQAMSSFSGPDVDSDVDEEEDAEIEDSMSEVPMAKVERILPLPLFVTL